MFIAVDPTGTPEFMLKAALKGFDVAHQRFRDVTATGGAIDEVFIPLSEALWWAVIVDDGFESLASNGQGYRPNLGDYRNARNRDPAGEVLVALRYARDRCGHQSALVASYQLPTLPIRLPAVLGAVFCWRPSGSLPPPDPRHDNPAMRAEYGKLLAGRPAAAALDSAERWFQQERARAQL